MARDRHAGGSARATRSASASSAPSFADAIAFVVRIGFLAEAADHHPDLDIRWRTVVVALTHARRRRAHRDSTSRWPRASTQRSAERADRGALVRARFHRACSIGVLFIAVAIENGPEPADVALAYEMAWDRLDFDTLFDLSGPELRDGAKRPGFIATKRAAYEGVQRGRLAARIAVENVVAAPDTALVVTNVSTDDGAVRNNVLDGAARRTLVRRRLLAAPG